MRHCSCRAAKLRKQGLTFLLHAQIQCRHDIALPDRRMLCVCCITCVARARIRCTASLCFGLPRRDTAKQPACGIRFQKQSVALCAQLFLAQKLQTRNAALLSFIEITDQMAGGLLILVSCPGSKRIGTVFLPQTFMNRRVKTFCTINLIPT